MSYSDVKSEPMETDPVDLETVILDLCRKHPRGLSHKIVKDSLPNVSPEQCVEVINGMLKTKKIELLSSKKEPGVVFYRLPVSNQTSASAGTGITDAMEKTVYQIIQESDNLGIAVGEIRSKTRLPPVLLNRTLKALETKRVIKAVKSVHGNRRQVMGYSLKKMNKETSDGFRFICSMNSVQIRKLPVVHGILRMNSKKNLFGYWQNNVFDC